MNKWFMRVASFLLVFGLLIGCSSNEDNNATNTNQTETNTAENNVSEEQNEDTVTITLSVDEKTEFIDEKEIPIEEGDILMDVLKKNFIVEEEGGFINSIEGVAPEEDEEKAWMFFINDEMAPKGAGETELSPGDKVSFDLQSY